jgi:hypothetical protein
MIGRDRLVALAVAAVIFGVGEARAASPEMLRLFEQGRALVKEGRCEEAIPKFLDALAIEPSVGALLNLGECYERLGKPALARRRFLEAAALAGEGDAVRASEAKNRAAKLESAVATVGFTRRYEPELGEPRITVDGEAVPPRADHVEVDPGRHEIVVRFPELAPHSETITPHAGENLKVVISAPLAKRNETAQPPPPPPPPPPQDEGLGTARWTAIGVASAGLLGVGVGTAFGFVAMSRRSDLDGLCPGYPHCPDAQRADVQTKYDDAKSAATISTVGFVAGGAVLAAGVVLWFVLPNRSSTTTGAITPRANGASIVW